MTSARHPWWVRHAGLLDRIIAGAGVVSILVAVSVLLALIGQALVSGWSRLTWDFLVSFPSRIPEQAGIYSAWVGTVWVVVCSAFMTVPLGVMAAIYLEEYASRRRFARLLEINIANLAGVPSIIYGLLGLGLFVRALGLGRSVAAGAATLALLMLPIIILATREALKSTPSSLRESSYALGATQWQTIWHQILPASGAGILTGIILAVSRAVGETAPLIMIGALTYVAFLPAGLLDAFTVLPIQTFNWISRPQQGFILNASAAVVVLLVLTLLMNGLAIWLRQHFRKQARR